MSVTVHLLPALMEQPLPAGCVGVVIDVLRASTTIIHALAHGARTVIPTLTVEEALAQTDKLPERPLLGGERHSQLIPGFDLDNSPLKYTADIVSGRTLVFTTTNGTKALHSCSPADEVLIGAFVNRAAIVNRLSQESRPVHLICAGTDGFLTAEDILFAGAVASDLLQGQPAADVQTQMAIDFYKLHARTPEEFLQTMYDSRGGRNLLNLGLKADVDRAATENLFEIVPVWRPSTGVITVDQ